MASRSATSRARGLAGRCLHWRNRATAAPLLAATSSWKPPTPLQGQNPARRQQGEGCRQGIPAAGARPLPLQLGPTGGAADRFGVEAAIAWVVKLLLAGRAERKVGQGGVGAGVGLGAGD